MEPQLCMDNNSQPILVQKVISYALLIQVLDFDFRTKLTSAIQYEKILGSY